MCLSAQKEPKPLQIGDTIPNIPFEQFLEKNMSGMQLEALKGKLVILDFWNIGCLACLQSMPKMELLQRQFEGQLQIIFVTNNAKEEVNRLFGRIKIKKPSLPFVVADSNYYKKLFPHEGDPLHVWIDGEGVVKAITDGHNATVSHVKAMLSGETPKLATRAAKREFFGSNGLFEASAGQLRPYVQGYSIVFKNLDKETAGNTLVLVRDTTSGNLRKITAINIPLTTLYSLAFSRNLFGFDVNVLNLPLNNRIQIKTNNPLDVRRSTVDSVLDEWRERNLWSYEAETKLDGNAELLNILQDDLNKYTPFNARIERQRMICLVLKRVGKTDMLKTKHRSESPEVYLNEQFVVRNSTLQNSLLPQLVQAFQALPYPVLDKTDYHDPVDMKLDVGNGSVRSYNRALRRYNLTLVLEKRLTRLLVIRDKRHSSANAAMP